MTGLFEGNAVDLPVGRVELECNVADARLLDGVTVVLLDPSAGPRGRQFPNLIGLDARGSRLWTARPPTSSSADRWVGIVRDSPLVVDSFCSRRCVIDTATGTVLSEEFSK